MGDQERRVRAWVLVQADEAQEVADRIRGLDPRRGDEFVVIRADVVEGPGGYPYNIIVPVDAKNKGKLTDVVGMIRAVDGVSEAVELEAKKHHPDPPHDAQAYVTDEEVGAGRDRDITPGRQGASPGANPWG
jgi:hypothetical protein